MTLPPIDYRNHRVGFGLLEILVLIGVFALVVVLSYPSYKRSGLMGKAEQLKADLQLIARATNATTLELNAPPGSLLTFEQIRKHLKAGSKLEKTGLDPFGNPYGNQRNDGNPMVPMKSAEQLRNVVPEGFWESFPVRGEL